MSEPVLDVGMIVALKLLDVPEPDVVDVDEGGVVLSCPCWEPYFGGPHGAERPDWYAINYLADAFAAYLDHWQKAHA